MRYRWVRICYSLKNKNKECFSFYFLSTWSYLHYWMFSLLLPFHMARLIYRSWKLVSKLQTSFWKEGTMLGVYKHPEILISKLWLNPKTNVKGKCTLFHSRNTTQKWHLPEVAKTQGRPQDSRAPIQVLTLGPFKGLQLGARIGALAQGRGLGA